MENEQSTEKIIQLLEDQLAVSNQQNQALSKQIESLTQQVKNLTKLLYGSKSEKSKYNTPDGQGSLFDDDSSFSDSEHTEEQSVETITYTVVRKKQAKKRNDSFLDGVEIEEIHHHPEQTRCDCCQSQMTEAGTVIAREEAHRRYLQVGKNPESDIVQIKIGSKIRNIDHASIYLFEVSPNPHKIVLHLHNEQMEFPGRLKDYEKLSKELYRCHKSYIVNTNYIEKIDKDNRMITLTNGLNCMASNRLLKGLLK